MTILKKIPSDIVILPNDNFTGSSDSLLLKYNFSIPNTEKIKKMQRVIPLA
jgi:hypothetical protein